MNRALQMAYLEAETSARLARQFLANMSHELRTPLNAVIAFTSLVLDSRDLSPLHEEYLSSSLTSAEALLGIINQVLDFSKFHAQEEEEEEGGEEERPKSSDARPSLRVNARDVDFAVEICPLLRGEKVPKLLGDPVRLRQCLVNLCDNAAKFSKDTGGQALLSVEVEEGAFGELLVLAQVWDNGDGIPKDKQPLLFVPFSQVDCKYSRKHGGTGLGLAITKKIVDAMEGSIEVFSEGPDKGSTFTMQISFPVAADGEEGLQQGSPLRMTKLRYDRLFRLPSPPFPVSLLLSVSLPPLHSPPSLSADHPIAAAVSRCCCPRVPAKSSRSNFANPGD
ncbi:hypothetical protein GUITHDRAFT_62766 [Guillardia theta CCMP2712]|uniref:histidine kinase n=1 Tax=Guillardia theta (strain CCMP2712) TaxID=905079 RepID=L1K4A5_GUITC|nr:hypothetical protein GUITHDRAFT_62766 [Guillardia theta CCMP2712]EKX55434.1 hypothetical protein GUITHDRAFT_62766 [Guillardia theta CCMP2712]|eukprot:XP_005842414.1 hypothetical protein GUITHDRAFT_62766 [Guillardia theta CCMP2712]